MIHFNRIIIHLKHSSLVLPLKGISERICVIDISISSISLMYLMPLSVVWSEKKKEIIHKPTMSSYDYPINND